MEADDFTKVEYIAFDVADLRNHIFFMSVKDSFYDIIHFGGNAVERHETCSNHGFEDKKIQVYRGFDVFGWSFLVVKYFCEKMDFTSDDGDHKVRTNDEVYFGGLIFSGFFVVERVVQYRGNVGVVFFDSLDVDGALDDFSSLGSERNGLKKFFGLVGPFFQIYIDPDKFFEVFDVHICFLGYITL